MSKQLALFPVLSSTAGGIYQYSLTILKALENLRAVGRVGKIIVFCHQGDDIANFSAQFLDFEWKIWIRQSPAEREKGTWLACIRAWVGEGPHREAWREFRDLLTPGWRAPNPDKISWKPEMGAYLRSLNVDALLFTSPDALAFECQLPSMMAVHDLLHRIQPEFPEAGEPSEWRGREYIFRNAARFTQAFLVDSETGKADLLRLYSEYGVIDDQIFILPYLPAQYHLQLVPQDQVDACLKKYGVQSPYLFYPAQFWPHKNHLRIAQAMDLLKREAGIAVNLVLSGGNSGKLRQRTFARFTRFVQKANLDNQISFLGYVSEEDIPALYAGSWGLIMPTFNGPTNIPPLEAWAYGCPVVTSDLPGIREHSGDAAILVNPGDVSSIAEGIRRVWEDADLRAELIDRGSRRLSKNTPQDFENLLADALEYLFQQVE